MARKKTRKQKLPNGFGSIVKRTRNGKDEYRVYAPAVYDPKIKDYYQEPLGKVDSYNDGYKLLLDYHDNPKKIENKDITFGFICEKALELAEKNFKDNKMSKSNYSNLKVANNRVQENKIAKSYVLELRKIDLQAFLDELTLGYTSKNYIINITNRAFEYTNDYYDIRVNIDTDKLDIGKKEKSNKYKVIETEDIQLIYDWDDSLIKDIIWLSLYTGLRPNEILKIENKNIFIEDRYMIGGSKTDAGKNRVIPIHKDILDIVKKYYNPSKKYFLANLSNDKPISIKTYEKGFKELMEVLKLDNKGYYPYCTRHTFATIADECGFDPTILKLILGHSLAGDVTNSVYIHKKKELIIKEIDKLNFNIKRKGDEI